MSSFIEVCKNNFTISLMHYSFIVKLLLLFWKGKKTILVEHYEFEKCLWTL